MFGAAAHTRLATPKTVSANRNDERAPKRVRIELAVVAATTDPTRYSVTTQAYSRAPPISAIALGNRLTVRNSLVAYIATPPANTTDVPRYLPSSSRQLPVSLAVPVTPLPYEYGEGAADYFRPAASIPRSSFLRSE